MSWLYACVASARLKHCRCLAQALKIALGTENVTAIGCELIDRDDAVRIGRGDQIAGIHQPHADAARDRRGDRAVAEIDLAAFTAPWSVNTVPSNSSTNASWVSTCCEAMEFCDSSAAIALEIQLRELELRLVVLEGALGLHQSGLKRRGVDLRQ